LANGAAVWVEKIDTPQVIEKVFEGRTWNMVKWLPAISTNWYSTNDNLKGTEVVGTEGD
jgi:hypothetical protein